MSGISAPQSTEPEADMDVHTSLVELAQASLTSVPLSTVDVAIDPALMDEGVSTPRVQRSIIPSPPISPTEISLYHPDVDDQSLAALAEATDGMQHATTAEHIMNGYAETLGQAQAQAKHYQQHEQHAGFILNGEPGPSMIGPPDEINFLPPPDSPHPLKFQLECDDDFLGWLENQRRLVKWRLVRDFSVAAKQEKDRERAREKRDKAREERARELGIPYVPKPIRSYKRPQNPQIPVADRERNYQCPSHGTYNPVPNEKRKRYRAPTITCGCPANIKVSSFANGLLEVNWFWKHEGHVPGEKKIELAPLPPPRKQRVPKDKKTTPIAAAAPLLPGDSGAQPHSNKSQKEEGAVGTLASLMGESAGPSRHESSNRHGVPESAVRGS